MKNMENLESKPPTEAIRFPGRLSFLAVSHGSREYPDTAESGETYDKEAASIFIGKTPAPVGTQHETS